MKQVIVVGGGPAGSSAAIAAARAGATVHLFEAQAFPRDCPGECLHPGVEPILRELNVWRKVKAAGFIRSRGQWIERGREINFRSFGGRSNLALHVWRAEFDDILLNEARALGVTVHQGCRAKLPVVSSGKITGVQTESGFSPCTHLIDASGARHWLARHLSLHFQHFSPRLIARYRYLPCDPSECNEPRFRFEKKSWSWFAKVRPNLKQELIVGPLALMEQSTRKFRSADVTWRLVSSAASANYFITGDAAGVIDPSISQGVLKALVSGILAGRVVASNTSNATFLRLTYARWYRAWFLQNVDQLQQLHDFIPTGTHSTQGMYPEEIVEYTPKTLQTFILFPS